MLSQKFTSKPNRIMKNAFFFVLFMWALTACKKENNTAPKIEPPAAYVPIYFPDDTTRGASYAKKIMADFRAQATCQYNNFISPRDAYISMYTYTEIAELREVFRFVDIKLNGSNKYKLINLFNTKPRPGYIRASYTTFTSDGDVIEDYYDLDSTATDNQMTITKLDLAAKRIEGLFTATYVIDTPARNDLNPPRVKFSNGRFWAVIRD
jgi:hypothetical protein